MYFDIPNNLKHKGWAAFGEAKKKKKIKVQFDKIENEGDLFSQIEDVPF